MSLSDQITISLSTSGLIVTASVIMVVVMGLFYYVWTLNRKVEKLTPKFGFAGKKIVAIAFVAFLAGAAPMITLLTLRSTEIRRQAKEVQDTIVNAHVLERVDEKVVVGFAVVPMENGIAWVGESYDVVWEVTGPTNFTFLEQGVTKEYPSYIIRELTPGEYKVEVKVSGEGFEVYSVEEVILK